MDKKFIIAVSIFTILILGGGIWFASSSSSKAVVGKSQGVKLETYESNFDFKTIKYDSGNVQHGFKIKNVGTEDLNIANLATSCMCTEVYFKSKEQESPKFGMKGHSAESSWKGVLKPGEEGQIVAVYDPTAHGPSGVGPVSRFVSFETNDPDHPYTEFSFLGTVVK